MQRGGICTRDSSTSALSPATSLAASAAVALLVAPAVIAGLVAVCIPHVVGGRSGCWQLRAGARLVGSAILGGSDRRRPIESSSDRRSGCSGGSSCFGQQHRVRVHRWSSPRHVHRARLSACGWRWGESAPDAPSALRGSGDWRREKRASAQSEEKRQRPVHSPTRPVLRLQSLLTATHHDVEESVVLQTEFR